MSDIIENNYPRRCKFCETSVPTKKRNRYMCTDSDIPGLTLDGDSTCTQFKLAKQFAAIQYHDCLTCAHALDVSADNTRADCAKHSCWVNIHDRVLCDYYTAKPVTPETPAAICRNCAHMLPADGYHPGDNACFCVRPLPWWIRWFVSTPRVKKLDHTCKHCLLKTQHQR